MTVYVTPERDHITLLITLVLLCHSAIDGVTYYLDI